MIRIKFDQHCHVMPPVTEIVGCITVLRGPALQEILSPVSDHSGPCDSCHLILTLCPVTIGTIFFILLCI